MLAVLALKPNWAVAVELAIFSLLNEPATFPQLKILPEMSSVGGVSPQFEPPLHKHFQGDVWEGVGTRPDTMDSNNPAHQYVTPVSYG